MIMFSRMLLLMMAVALLSACAVAPPFKEQNLAGVNRSLSPGQAVKEEARNVQVLWGGVIVKAQNLRDHTDFTVLAFPLDKKSQRPDTDKVPGERFIARYSGYLETMVYEPGRRITLIGTLQGVEDGKVGDAPYRFPVVKVNKLYLWPLDSDSKVHFGVGVGIGVHM